MLTPGEFVVNRAATQKNLPLLKAINNGVGGYSDGGVVYLQAGGRPGMGQIPQRGPRDKDEVAAYKRGGLRDRLRYGSKERFAAQAQAADKNRAGKLWIFTVPTTGLLTDSDGKPLNNGLQYLLKDANGRPSNSLSTESLAAMDINKIFSLRANSAANAKKSIQEIDNGRNNRVEASLAIDAVSAISKARQQNARKSFDQRILDELSYQIQVFGTDIFGIFNRGFFNIDDNVINKYNKDFSDIIDNINFNDPASVLAGMAALGPKVKRVKDRRDYLNEIITNNKQALAVLKKANLDFTDSANMRDAFQGKLPTEIHDAQITMGSTEKGFADKILTNLLQRPKLQAALRNPVVAQSVQRFLVPTVGFGVPISTFEAAPQPTNIPQRLARGGIVYANNGQLINFQPRGTDTVPAMLTPGEFVVNKSAAQQNLPLLQSLNNGYYSNGGSVAYLANGTPGTDELYKSLSQLSSMLSINTKLIGDTLTKLSQTLNSSVEKININDRQAQGSNGVSNRVNPAATIDALGNKLDRFIEQLQNIIPPVIRVEGQHQVNVVINGGSILQQLLSGPIGNIVQSAIENAFAAKNRQNECAY